MNNKLVHHSKYTREEIKLRNKAMYDAVEISGETVISQARAYGITSNAAKNAINQYKKNLLREGAEVERLALINNLQVNKLSVAKRGIEVLGLSMRITNALRSENIHVISDLLVQTDDILLRIPNLGRACLNEIKAALNQFELELNS